MEFRLLKAEEIECRVSTISEKGVSLLLYKDARVDQNILDETVGSSKWQRTHEVISGNLFCNVGIWCDDLSQWVWKQDVGTESYTEKEKGQASDAFKRACFNWGIGRELYTAPFIWLNAPDNVDVKQKNGKWTTYDRFHISKINYKNRKINAIEIVNKKNEVVFSYEPQNFPIDAPKVNIIKKDIEDGFIKEVDLCVHYGILSIEQMTEKQFRSYVATKQSKVKTGGQK